MDHLTKQLEHTRLQDNNTQTPLTNESVEETVRADKLIRRLISYSETKSKGASKRKRTLVRGNRFRLDLEHERNASTSTSKSKSMPTSSGSGSGSGSAATPGRRHYGPDGSKIHINTLTVTSWKMNEFEYSKGTLPTQARGLFTYQDPLLPRATFLNKTHPEYESLVSKKCLIPEEEQQLQQQEDEEKAEEEDNKTSVEPTTTGDDFDPDNGGIHRILVRGYDKFFNIGEVRKTTQEWIAEETKGPYEVTLKENGCIIFMAGLPPHLVGPQGGCVVTSKHFLGEQDPEKNNDAAAVPITVGHSSKGREWLEKSLAAKGKTMQEFGLWLWNQNLTAVAELCDDSFEEHILEYPIERSGLYLHGLNRNTLDFQTLPSNKVQEAAKEWGFWLTDFTTFNSYQEVMAFADKVRSAGEYDNRPVEGFVVRCKTKHEGETHFFKIKYDEPYLMYREWREITKRMLTAANKAKKDAGTSTGSKHAGELIVPADMNIRMKYPLTKPYVEFVKDLMKTRPELFATYNKNQGIIAIRDLFLQAWEAKSSKEQDSSLKLSSTATGGKKSSASFAADTTATTTNEDYQRTVLIPIATIGCGKTTASVALSKLFGWAHVSSDDFHHFRNAGQRFLKEIVDQLKTNTVVIADRNNHESLHRERIMAKVRSAYPNTRFVALFWSHEDLPINTIRELEIERVQNRGTNHQSLVPEDCPEFESVIQRFLWSFEPLNPMMEPDSNFSYVVESKVGEESVVFVKRIVDEFAISVLGMGGPGQKPIPSLEDIKEAVRYAIEDWKPPRVASGEADKIRKQKQEQQQAQLLKEPVVTISNEKDRVKTEAVAAPVPVKAGKKVKEPKYFAIKVETGAVLRFLDEFFGEQDEKDNIDAGISNAQLNQRQSQNRNTGPKDSNHDKELWTQFRQQLRDWKKKNRIGPYQHITLVHVSALKDPSPQKAQRAEQLWKKYKEEVASKARATSPASSSNSLPASPPPPSEEQSASGPQTQGDDGFTKVSMKTSGKKGKKGHARAPPAPTTVATNTPSSSISTPSSAANNSSKPSAATTSTSTSTVDTLGDEDLQATAVVDYVVWTERMMTLRVATVKRTISGQPCETTQEILHITVGTVGDHVKPYESNEVLRRWRSTRNYQKGGKHNGNTMSSSTSSSSRNDVPVAEIFALRLEEPKVFNGYLKAMMF
ncbi:hypothetical protein BGX28_006688 [Mortierella sp. GBA30]|nr:hypothetical protein BGX28_006688 [Mortierella sp. GBA30]